MTKRTESCLFPSIAHEFCSLDFAGRWATWLEEAWSSIDTRASCIACESSYNGRRSFEFTPAYVVSVHPLNNFTVYQELHSSMEHMKHTKVIHHTNIVVHQILDSSMEHPDRLDECVVLKVYRWFSLPILLPRTCTPYVHSLKR